MFPFRYYRSLLHICKFSLQFSTRNNSSINVCIVGSGPAGFYTAQQVLKNPYVNVDIYEKLPVPFGLVRFGVAPDHPEVKNVINTFTTTASNPRCQFLGNVTLGKDVTLKELKEAYNCIILAYGADQDTALGIPGEDLPNVVSARKFVGWYNGLPQDAHLQINLDTECAIVIGQGNVALDVARILLSPIDKLHETDITEESLEKLSKSRVKRVILIGRRGPLQVAFTIKELREIIKLSDCRTRVNQQHFDEVQKTLQSLDRPRKRLTELIMQAESKSSVTAQKEFIIKFLRSPRAILSSDSGAIRAVQLGINTLQGEGLNAKAVLTDAREEIEGQLVLPSIGYKSISVDDEIPFDKVKGLIPNTDGRVHNCQGLYCSGWLKTGPVGVIASTMNNSFETGQAVLNDIERQKECFGAVTSGQKSIMDFLKGRGVNVVTFDDWKKIDAHERELGLKKGKSREKIISIPEMLRIAKEA